MNRYLRVFLCHASQDKPAVRELYRRLSSEKWIEPWLDEENLLPGQDFDLEIYKATREADAIIICLSKVSVTKEGYVNREIRRALDISKEKGEGAIYVIPLRLDECDPSFEQIKKLHWVDYFTPNAHEKLLKSLRLRAASLKIEIWESQPEPVLEASSQASVDIGLDLYHFIQIDVKQNSGIPYSYWIGKYPVTNEQYERFLKAPDFSNPVYWLEYPEFNENCERVGDWGNQGRIWLQDELKKARSTVLLPRYWDYEDFGKSKRNHPVIGISWYEAGAYCEWLSQNWDTLLESKANSFLRPQTIRLPLDTEWTAAAGLNDPDGRFPWDAKGQITQSTKEILRRVNVSESEIGHTQPVTTYTQGKSPWGVMDMAGNAWEWQANYYDSNHSSISLRGGSWLDNMNYARVSCRYGILPEGDWRLNFGFRVVILNGEFS